MPDAKTPQDQLAINGGPKAVDGLEGKSQPKVGVEEFLEIAKIWGFSDEALGKIQDAVAEQQLPGNGPHLTRYYNPNPSKVEQLEALVRELFNVKFALALHSGTSALETAYIACRVGPGTEVIVPGYTFFATAAAVVSAKAIPVIAEIDESLTLDPADVERKITPRTKAIVPVHMQGTNANMEAIMEIANRRGVQVIEDVAQACGASFKGKRLGTFGAAGCFSISTYKMVGAGEAGLVLTNDEMTYTRAQNHHDTGACWRPDRYAKERESGELFCGTNYRLSELEGAVNLVQFQKMDDVVNGYRNSKLRVVSQLERFKGITPQAVNDYEGEMGYRLAFFAPTPAEAKKIAQTLAAEGVGGWARGAGTEERAARDWHIYSYWEHILEQKSATEEGCPFTCPFYKAELPKYSPDMCPRTIDLMSRVVTVSISRWWTEEDCDKIAAGINKVLGALYKPTGKPWRG